MAETEGYRVPEVCRLVGISYRQLDYWARTGLVTFQDLVQLRTIKSLLDTGISLQQIRKAVVFLRKHLGTEPTSVTLMSDGVRVYAAQSEDEIIDLVKRGQGVFAIALDKVWEDLSTTVGRKRAARSGSMARAGGT
jgi:DNA-binding transcriptional MerR regulator